MICMNWIGLSSIGQISCCVVDSDSGPRWASVGLNGARRLALICCEDSSSETRRTPGFTQHARGEWHFLCRLKTLPADLSAGLTSISNTQREHSPHAACSVRVTHAMEVMMELRPHIHQRWTETPLILHNSIQSPRDYSRSGVIAQGV